MNLMILGLAALPMGCVPVACQPDATPAPPAEAAPFVPSFADPGDDCPGTHVTVRWDEALTCDTVAGQRLDVVFDASFDSEWGGDASVERAAQECDDMGGRQFWVNDGNYRLICQGVDF